MMQSKPLSQDARFVSGLVLASVGGFGLFGALVVLLLGGVFQAVFPRVFGTPWQDLALDEESQTCPGQLLEVSPNPGLTVSGRPTLRIRYSYRPSHEVLQAEIVVTDNDALASARPGTPVTVEHLPHDPAVSRIQGRKVEIAGLAGAIGLGFGALGAVLTLLCLIMVALGVILMIQARRHRRGPS